MCGWHVHMQITCEQCPDATCRENHQHRLCHKSFTWSWNETTQHCCDKFHSITSFCHSRKIVQVHADHEEFCRWRADDICTCRWHTCLRMTCRWCTCLRMMFLMTYVIHQPNLQWNLTLVSSACRPHEISTPKIFPLKEQTALLKSYPFDQRKSYQL